MTQDPYRPPRSPVEDLAIPSPAAVPLEVANGIRLLWIDVWLTIAYFGWALTSVPTDNIVSTLVTAFIFVGLSVFLVLMLRKQHGWPRYVYIVLIVLAVLNGFTFPEGSPAMEYFFFYAMLAVEALALMLLFSKPAQRWYGPTK